MSCKHIKNAAALHRVYTVIIIACIPHKGVLPLWGLKVFVGSKTLLARDKYTLKGSISVSGQLPIYPSPNPTLTLSCYQLTVVELGEG